MQQVLFKNAANGILLTVLQTAWLCRLMAAPQEISLQKAWQLRNAQNLEGAEELFRHLSARPSLGADPLELKLFEVSLLRARKHLDRSEQVLSEVKNEITETGQAIPFQYYLQKGLNLFLQGYFPSALEYFNQAALLTEDPEFKSLALGNQLLCLDNLNLNTDLALEKLLSLKNVLPKEYVSQVIKPQLQTLLLRQSFRQGNLGNVFPETHPSIEVKSADQAQYFQMWAGQLPFIILSKRPHQLEALVGHGHLIWKKFRLHTLQMDARFEDEVQVKPSERIDRLYLWTWKWMVQPESVPVKMLEQTWLQLDPCEVCSQTTVEDFILLRLCMRWTRLFERRWARPVTEWLAKSTPPHVQEPPLFQLESQVLDFFEACQKKDRRSSERALQRLNENPLFHQESLGFKIIVESYRASAAAKPEEPVKKQMVRLARRLAGLLKASPPKATKALFIDMQSFRWRKGSQSGVSEPLCILIESLKRQDHLHFSEVLEKCFSMGGYNEDIHRNKIMNLLTRVRRLLPAEIEIFTKDQIVYSNGGFQNVRFHSSEVSEVRLEQPRIFDRPCADLNQHHMDRWIQPRLVFKKLGSRNVVTRVELQDMLGLSKATTNRLLRRWVDEGFLSLQKSGRAICYHIDNTYFSRLSSSDS